MAVVWVGSRDRLYWYSLIASSTLPERGRERGGRGREGGRKGGREGWRDGGMEGCVVCSKP